MHESPVGFVRPLEPEDRLRADFYALFARLYFSAPDADLLRTMGNAPLLESGPIRSPFALAWERLAAASSVMDADAAQEEYDALFGGVGKSLVSLYLSYYAGADSPGVAGRFLVDLRAELVGLGLSRQTGQNIPEDHVAALFETMRLLIAGTDDLPTRAVETQREFFRKYIAPWHSACCNAIIKTTVANFYITVAECTEAFLAIEDESLAIA